MIRRFATWRAGQLRLAAADRYLEARLAELMGLVCDESENNAPHDPESRAAPERNDR